jgi:hypothetical protein
MPKRYKAEQPVNPTLAKILEMSDLLSVFQLGRYNANDCKSIAVSDDPYNLKYYVSKQYKKFTGRYGIPVKILPPLPISIIRQIDEIGYKSSTKSDDVLNEEYGWVLALDTTTILRECVKRCLPLAQESIESLLMSIESSIVKDNTSEKGSSIDSNDMGTIIHHMIGIYSNLILAMDGQCEKINAYALRIREFITSCLNQANEIRNNLFTSLEDGFFFYSLHFFQGERQDAMDEIVKNGRTEKLMELDMKKTAADEMMDYKA